MSGIHHFVPVMHRGDAIGRHTLRLRDATRASGFDSDIFVDVMEPDTAGQTVPAVRYAERAATGDVIVYQFATASFMARWLVSRRETLVVNYHNITPPELLAPWDNHLALGQVRAQADLRLLAPRTALAISDSAYNQAHLTEAGFAATAVIPPSAALDSDTVSRAGRAHHHDTDASRGSRWLAVGRVAPNKALQDTIAALAVARSRRDPDATLVIIGKPATALYDRALHRYVAELGLSDAVTFGGHASDAAVAAAYAAADVLVVTSEHEGFCVPVVEAMSVGLPVVAFAQGALPEVLGDAGTFVPSKDPFALAGAITALLGDTPRLAARADAARTQMAELALDTAAQRFVELLVDLAQRESGTVSAVHQFVPMLHRGDAVGRHTVRLRDLLVARGIESRIYVETIDPDTAEETQRFESYPDDATSGDVLVYQFATASDIAGWLRARPETLVVNYHNVTPPEYYAPWDNGLARHQLRARSELAGLAARASLGIAMSAFNEAELRAVGFTTTSIVPPAAMLPTQPRPGATSTPAGRGAKWLSVGRMAPNKMLQHAIMALLVTRDRFDDLATLDIVGRSVVPAYTGALRRFVDELGLRDAVTFHGYMGDEALTHSMAGADALIVSSDHEGFGVPVVEAMSSGLAVVANDAGALPEVLGQGGILLDTANPFATAEAFNGLTGNAEAIGIMAAGAAAQLASLNLATAGDRAVDQIMGVR